jgi:hypothetical protein
MSAGSVTRWIDLTSASGNAIAEIHGCWFASWTTDAIRVTPANGNISDNKDCRVNENGTNQNLRYDGNTGFDGSTFGTGSTSRADGVQAGLSTTIAEGGFKIAAISTPVGNVGAGEDDLQTFNVPANCLAKDKAVVEIESSGITANNATAKTFKLYFGGTAILTVSLPVSVAGFWTAKARVVRTGVDTQRYSAELVTVAAAGAAFIATNSGTLAKDDGAAIIVKTTGEAGANDDIVSELLVGKGYN